MSLRTIIPVGIIAVLAISWLSLQNHNEKTTGVKRPGGTTISTFAEKKLKEKVLSARSFISKKDFNNKVGFFIDMSLPAGKARFIVYDLIKDSIIGSGLVAHGNCFQDWLEGRRYSNVVGSGCTSLGKYKIGEHYIGKFGYSYKLHGLDSTNDNAFERTVVLHSHSCVPEEETSDEICQSNGCPTVSPKFLEKLKLIINASKKPVLLWIYE